MHLLSRGHVCYNKSMKTIIEDIENGSIKRLYLLYGEEDYLKRQYRDKLKKALATEGDTMNLSCFEGKDVNVRQLIDQSETLPFFQERRVILVEGCGFFKNANEELTDYLPQIPETTCIIFVEDEVDKRSKAYKAVTRTGRAVDFSRPDEKTLMRWLERRVKKENKTISHTALECFIGIAGADMESMDHEMEKLLCYTMEKREITLQDIQEICVGQTENHIFQMVDAISARDQAKALTLYYELLELKEPPMRILFLIARQFRNLLLIKSMSMKGYPKDAIAKNAGIPVFAVSKNLSQAKAFSPDQLKQMISDCAQAEEDVKLGRLNDSLAVELLIVPFST